MSKGKSNNQYTGEFKQVVVETMMNGKNYVITKQSTRAKEQLIGNESI